MKKSILLFIGAIMMTTLSFSQSKKDLMTQVDRQQKTIDSLKAAIENYENIIENRDRSIRILQEDIAEGKKKLKEANEISGERYNRIEKLYKVTNPGKPKMMTLSNARSTLKVKEGHYWILHHFITDYTASIKTDSTGTTQMEEIHVFLKAVDDKVLTDPAKNLYGPKLYSSLHPEQTIRFPIVLTEGTKFTIAVFKGKLGDMQPHNAEVYCSFTEKSN